MRKIKFENPTSEKAFKITKRITVGLLLAYLLFAVCVSVFVMIGDWVGWGLFLLLAFMLLGLGFASIIIAAANFARHKIFVNGGIEIPDKTADSAFSTAALVSGLLTALMFALDMIDFKMYSLLWKISFDSLASVFLVLMLSCLLFDALCQFLSWFMKNKIQDVQTVAKYVKSLRVTAIILAAVIFLGALFIPFDCGTYNDASENYKKGSKYYKAVMYEVIVWQRHRFDEGEDTVDVFDQSTRVYFFPFNCYSYYEKWEMKH